jgi:bacterioferritin-associated ferredoxin
MVKALSRLPHASDVRRQFSWNGDTVEARDGDTLAAALHAAGVRNIAPSRKFHDPRGLSGSFAAGHLACVDAMPHRRIDRVAVRQDMQAATQNVWPSARFDLLTLARLAPRAMLRAGFEHPRLVSDGSLLWRPWERLLAFIAGAATPPAGREGRIVDGHRLKVHTVVVGGGPTGREAAIAARGPVLLISRSAAPGASASAAGADLPPLPDSIEVLSGHDVFALYDGGRLIAAAPHDPDRPAVLIDAADVVLATGARSTPPLVPGVTLPGVLSADIALALAAHHGVPPGNRTVVIGTAQGQWVFERLGALGCKMADFVDVADVSQISGRGAVEQIHLGGKSIACDAVVHAGPWRPDPALPFQAAADGELRLLGGDLPAHVRLTGTCAEAPEAVSLGQRLNPAALVCPCMDVTVGEIVALIDSGITHVEELKRRTGCGMGTCQGVPCWDLLAAVVAEATGRDVAQIGHPTYRPPRAALTFGQAAGLADITEVAP